MQISYPQQGPASLLITQQKMFEERFEKYPPQISEYTFTNLYGWKDYYGFEWQEIDGCIVLFCRQRGKRCAYVPIGPAERVPEVMRTVARQEDIPFVRVPEDVKNKSDTDFLGEDDPDNADYLYNAKDLIELAGRKYDGKRNLIRKFSSEHRFEYQPLDAVCIRECLKFQESWCMEVNCSDQPGLKAEDAAVKVMLENFQRFHLVGGALRVDGVISGLALGQKLNPDTLVMHVLKASRLAPGLYQTLYQEFLKREAHDYRFINMEQDLGIEGLRKAKLSYHPCAMMKKFTLSLRQA